MTLTQARAMAGTTTWASHSREQVDAALAIVTRALDGAEADLANLIRELHRTVVALGGSNDLPTAMKQFKEGEYLADLAERRMADLAALKARTCNNDETREYVFTAGWQSARQERPAEYQETEHELRHSAYLYWAAKEQL